MCAIAGILGPGGDAGDRISSMIARMAHRGPDGQRMEAGPNWSLGHARLSVIDLEKGWQPLHAAGSIVVGNGEIYNYIELIEEFDLSDRLSTESDFEPLLHLYADQGERAFALLRGMFSFCLVGYDNRTWVVRDPFGIKPLYYTSSKPELCFSSEARALLVSGAGGLPKVDKYGAEQVLSLNYSLNEASLYTGIRRIPPGMIAEVGGGGAP